MDKFFRLDNPVWNFLGKATDMIVLSLLFVVCSLPVLTIGASFCALWDVSLRLAEDQEGNVVKDFFKCFRKHFKRGTIVFLILFAIGCVLAVDFMFVFYIKNLAAKTLGILFFVLALVYAFVFTYIFPFLVKTKDSVRELFGRAFVLSIQEFPKTILMVLTAVSLTAAGVFICAPFLVVVPGLTVLLQSYIFHVILRKYHLEGVSSFL